MFFTSYSIFDRDDTSDDDGESEDDGNIQVEGRGREGELRSENAGQISTRMSLYFIVSLKKANNNPGPGLRHIPLPAQDMCYPMIPRAASRVRPEWSLFSRITLIRVQILQVQCL